MTKEKLVHLAIIAFSIITCFSLRAGSFRLDINDVSGLDAPWPLVASIPFPEGEITDASAIRITSGGMEVPSQVDVAARWRDGSIRWALGGFTASPQGEYTVEYGEGVKRGAYSVPLKVDRSAGGGFSVDTGAAVYRFEGDKLLPEEAWLAEGRRRIQILQGAGAGAYLVDNAGRQARVSGEAAEIEHKVLKEGPGRFVIKRSGYYATEEGERLARAEAWFYFSAGSPYVRVTHSIIFTENTDELWFRDYGLEFKTPVSPRRVFCSLGEPGKEDIREVNAQGGEVYLLQDQYPHFAEREYRAVIGKSSRGEDAVIEEILVAGDWAHGDYGSWGLTISMPWLAQRFPKELSFGQSGARAVLWSGRSKRELDFRAKTLEEEYFGRWRKGFGGNAESNAQGGARTHDIWLLPHAGSYNGEHIRKTAVAGSRPPLALEDTAWLCATEAMGYPMLHKDTARFPEEEAMISEYWDRFLLPLRAFPMKGFIAWGCHPARSYFSRGGQIMANHATIQNLREYGVRREPWRHYARSGERRYYDYGHRFSRFTGDWFLAHSDAPGKQRGGFIKSSGGGLPLFWGDSANSVAMNAGDIGHWLLEYYLTGDERSLALVEMIKESFMERIDKELDRTGYRPGHFHAYQWRVLTTLFIKDWDEEVGKRLKRVVREAVDLESQNGFRLFATHYGPMYKDHRTSHNYLEYYMETGDELAKEGFLKLIDQRYRFDRRWNPAASYKNYDAFTYSIAYWMTGDERYRRAAENTIDDALYYFRQYPLAEELAKLPEDIFEWEDLPDGIFLGHHEYHSGFIGFPTGLKLLAEEGRTGKKTPVVVKPMEITQGHIIFLHEKNRETTLSLAWATPSEEENKPEVFSFPRTPQSRPVPGVKMEVEERMPLGPFFSNKPERYAQLFTAKYFHGIIQIPAEKESGLYMILLGEKDTFSLLDISSGKAALYCPEGFWAAARDVSYGSPGEGRPFFFRVPAGLDELNILVTMPCRIIRADGSAAVDIPDEKLGRLKIPVEGKSGVWSIEPYLRSFKGDCPPAFFQLLNVEPIVAFGLPKYLPEGTPGKLPEIMEMPLEPREAVEFAGGLQGKALFMSGGKELKFPRGEKVDEGGYAYFPGNKGTAEFWYKANLNTYKTPLLFFQNRETRFIKGPYLDFKHSYRVLDERGWARRLHSMLQMEWITREPLSRGITVGAQAKHYFTAGEWVHIAYTWDIEEQQSDVFVNGRKMPFYQTRPGTIPPGLLPPTRAPKNVRLSDEGDDIILGSFEGTVDMLRLSDIVRYTENFIPSKTIPEIDGHTRALFLFDGDMKGASAFSSEPVEAK